MSKKRHQCSEPQYGALVTDYTLDLLNEGQSKIVEEHLLLCFACQKQLSKLEVIFSVVRDHSNDWIYSGAVSEATYTTEKLYLRQITEEMEAIKEYWEVDDFIKEGEKSKNYFNIDKDDT